MYYCCTRYTRYQVCYSHGRRNENDVVGHQILMDLVIKSPLIGYQIARDQYLIAINSCNYLIGHSVAMKPPRHTALRTVV